MAGRRSGAGRLIWICVPRHGYIVSPCNMDGVRFWITRNDDAKDKSLLCSFS